MSRARVPSLVFPIFLFLEKVIMDAINVIKTNKKNLKNKWCVNIFLVVMGGGGEGNREKLRDIPICFRRITFITIKGGGRPTRLLPHAKMLLIPIELFLSAG